MRALWLSLNDVSLSGKDVDEVSVSNPILGVCSQWLDKAAVYLTAGLHCYFINATINGI
ncbi:MAG: hypothetical protein RI942_24 [Pseudomonadota bacterium]